MHRHRWANPKPEDRCGYKECHHAEANKDILPNNAAGVSAQAHRERQMREVIGHERYVGRLQRHVGACSAHRDTYRRRRHCRGVIDAIANHGDHVLAS